MKPLRIIGTIYLTLAAVIAFEDYLPVKHDPVQVGEEFSERVKVSFVYVSGECRDALGRAFGPSQVRTR